MFSQHQPQNMTLQVGHLAILSKARNRTNKSMPRASHCLSKASLGLLPSPDPQKRSSLCLLGLYSSFPNASQIPLHAFDLKRQNAFRSSEPWAKQPSKIDLDSYQPSKIAFVFFASFCPLVLTFRFVDECCAILNLNSWQWQIGGGHKAPQGPHQNLFFGDVFFGTFFRGPAQLIKHLQPKLIMRCGIWTRYISSFHHSKRRKKTAGWQNLHKKPNQPQLQK